MSRVNLQGMQSAIISYVKSKIPKDKNFAHLGTISGNRVIIGNKSYPYVSTVDDYIGDGSGVYCILPNSGGVAAVVGVK